MSRSRRLWMVGVLLYLGFDYCDPVMPGVFFFDTESLVIESVDAKPETPVTISPAVASALVLRPPSSPPRIRFRAVSSSRVALLTHPPRAGIMSAPPPSPAEDH